MTKLTTAFCLHLGLLLALTACSRDPETPPAATPNPPAAQAAASPPPAQARPVDASRLTRPGSPVLGRATAPVTLVEFLDPACEACRAFAPVVKQVQFLYPEEVRVVVRFADFHEGSDEAIRILMAAQRQGRFEPVLHALFDAQEEWASHHSPDTDAAWRVAATAGLDMARARKDAASPESTRRLEEEAEDIRALQVSRTPTFYVNGKLLEDFGSQQLMKLVASEVEATRPQAPASN